ncbi:hypothetical protein PoB_004084300 [Plakobranchus ocellatus]|uniref:Uncharacterized protein n=1 Tax=Plakobranchus ocellatus TaxID=259542 RepID=A0AAV4B6C9_9GAST|nr:hypothetical protein PoB_004084300 [Plakobranchus ocellatus]
MYKDFSIARSTPTSVSKKPVDEIVDNTQSQKWIVDLRPRRVRRLRWAPNLRREIPAVFMEYANPLAQAALLIVIATDKIPIGFLSILSSYSNS